MHPLKAAIAVAHDATAKLHEATKDFEFTEGEKDKLIDLLLAYVPAAIDGVSGLFNAFIAYLTTR